MRIFWDPVVRPLLEAISARRIIAIGAAGGDSSARVARWCLRHGAHLDIVDPAPDGGFSERQSASAGHARMLAGLPPADAVLIDGDHNWHAVHHQLITLYCHAGPLEAGAPVVICHHSAWPYGRRDQYADPQGIPEDQRHAMARGGVVPGDRGLSPDGMNTHLHHAATEGGPRNGVRTGIVDALAGHREEFRVVWLEVGFGLAIIAPLRRIEAHCALRGLLDRLEPSANWKVLSALLEHERIVGVIARQRLERLQGGRAQVARPRGESEATLTGPRSFDSVLSSDISLGIQRGMMGYRYKGRRMLLHPFDIANYLALLGELRPATIFEIGALEGGRTLWLADMCRALGIGPRVIAVDLRPPAELDDAGITFLTGDARDLSRTLDDAMLRALPRPFLVIEDSAHEEATCLAVLTFFDRHLRRGDMIVVEDGNLGILLSRSGADSAPSAAIARFLDARGEDYDIDTEYCDRFGYNATANPNGWLRRR